MKQLTVDNPTHTWWWNRSPLKQLKQWRLSEPQRNNLPGFFSRTNTYSRYHISKFFTCNSTAILHLNKVKARLLESLELYVRDCFIEVLFYLFIVHGTVSATTNQTVYWTRVSRPIIINIKFSYNNNEFTFLSVRWIKQFHGCQALCLTAAKRLFLIVEFQFQSVDTDFGSLLQNLIKILNRNIQL